jgi:hypothetical protein
MCGFRAANADEKKIACSRAALPGDARSRSARPFSSKFFSAVSVNLTARGPVPYGGAPPGILPRWPIRFVRTVNPSVRGSREGRGSREVFGNEAPLLDRSAKLQCAKVSADRREPRSGQKARKSVSGGEALRNEAPCRRTRRQRPKPRGVNPKVGFFAALLFHSVRNSPTSQPSTCRKVARLVGSFRLCHSSEGRFRI